MRLLGCFLVFGIHIVIRCGQLVIVILGRVVSSDFRMGGDWRVFRDKATGWGEKIRLSNVKKEVICKTKPLYRITI